MFAWAYERSAKRHAATRRSIGEPDPFKLRYREELRAVVAAIVREKLSKASATRRIAEFAEQALPSADRKQFAEAAETELIGLHEGSFARFKIKPLEFFAWKAVWESG